MGKGDRERERLREERIAAEESEKQSGRNRMVIGYAVVSTVVLVAAVLIFVLVSGGSSDSSSEGDAHINLNEEVGNTNGVKPDERAGIVPAAAKVTNFKEAASKAGCELRLELKDEGHQHFLKGSSPPNYETTPPSSGNHVEAPFQQADGAYAEEPEQMNVVHSLEHGRMAIQYSPDLPEQAQLELKGLYDTMYGAALFFPYSDMPFDVAAVTWTNLLTCRDYKGAATLDAIRAFGKETWGKYGGEPVEAFTFKGPTPAAPDEP